MNLAKVGDLVVEITCRCGPQMVKSSMAPSWHCNSCGQRGSHGRTYRLLPVGWELAEAPG